MQSDQMNLFHKHYVFCDDFCIKPTRTSGVQDSKFFYGYHPEHEIFEVCKEMEESLDRCVRRQELKFLVCDFNSWGSFVHLGKEFEETFWWFYERLSHPSHESIETRTADALGIKDYRVLKTRT